MEPLEYQLQKFQIAENAKAAKKSNIVTVIGFLVTIFISLFATCTQLNMISDQISSQNKLEFRKTLWNEKKEAYSQIAKVISYLISYSNDRKRFDSLYSEFESQYWNVVVVFHTKEVESNLVVLKQDFQIIKEGSEVDELDLRMAEATFLNSCRASLDSTWKDY